MMVYGSGFHFPAEGAVKKRSVNRSAFAAHIENLRIDIVFGEKN